jgi:hypothetical protein
VLGGILAASIAGGANAAPFEPDPQRIILRLVDLDPGYRLGHDGSGCGAEDDDIEYGVTKTPHRLISCTIQFTDGWLPSSTVPRPATVDSGAWVFETEAGAIDNYASHRALLAFTYSVADGPLLTAPIPVGDQTAMYDSAHSDGYHTTSLVWRSGRVVAFVTAYAPKRSASESGALALAQRQQQRIVTPTPVAPRDNSNLWAFLDDPRLGLDIYWLGETFDPAGRLPRRILRDADYWHGPGWKARVAYGGAIDLGLWNPRRWERFKHSRLGRRFLCERCGKRTRTRLSGRRATIFASRMECLPGGKPKPCRSRKPNLFMAAVRIRDTVVSVNVPVCFTCGNTARDPYNSVQGMRAIAAALQVRVPNR